MIYISLKLLHIFGLSVKIKIKLGILVSGTMTVDNQEEAVHISGLF